MIFGRAKLEKGPIQRSQLGGLTYVAFARFVRLIPALPHADARHAKRLALRDAIKSLRRELRQVSGHALRRLFKRASDCPPLNPAEIRSVLICRLNGRLGNTLLLTPIIRRIHESLPDAAIDIATAYPKAANLLHNVPGIRHVIIYPHKSANAVWRYLVALRRMRAQSYDLAIDPVPDSTSGRVAITLARTRYRLGFDTFSQWAPLTHAVVLPDESMHDAVRPVFLLSQAFGVPLNQATVRLWLPMLEGELSAGRTEVTEALRVRDPSAEPTHLFGFFAPAAGHKTIDTAWWLEFWRTFRALAPDAIPMEFLSLAHGDCVDPSFPALCIKSPRSFAAAIAATRMFIAPDTGPMHLASSTAVPTIGLFRSSDTSRYRPMKPHDLMIDVTQNSPAKTAERCHRIWRQLDSANSADTNLHANAAAALPPISYSAAPAAAAS